MTVITGPSGSGKSSLAFDTIYAEGQRRYVESLSSYARQFLELQEKPDVDYIEGLSPAISIEQKSISKNPRSTVGTVTEIYDYLRLLFARLGHVYCYGCGKEIKSQHAPQIVDSILALGTGTQLTVLAPIVRGRKGEYRKEIDDLRKQGFTRIKLNGKVVDLSEHIVLDKNKKHAIDVIVDRLTIREGIERRLFEAVELALNKAGGIVKVETGKDTLVFSEKFACPDCGISYPEITPAMFSFNNPYGACPTCSGLGVKENFDPDLIVPNKELSLREGAIMPWSDKNPLVFMPFLESLIKHYKIDIRAPFKDLPPDVQDALFHGSNGEPIEFFVEHGRRHADKKTFRRRDKRAGEGVEERVPVGEGKVRALHKPHPLPYLQRRKVEKRDALGALRRPRHLSGHGNDHCRMLPVFQGGRSGGKGAGDQPGDPEGDRLPPEVPHRCRPRLHLPVAVLGNPVVRRIPADKARDPDRLRVNRRALCARRAEHRSPSAR